MNNLDDYIHRYLHPSNAEFFTVVPSDDGPYVEWLFDPEDAVPPMDEQRPSFPRVVPPTSREESRRRHPSSRDMGYDGGPGLRDGKHASRIKYLLREWL